MKFRSAMIAVAALSALAACSQKGKELPAITAAEVDGAAIEAADQRPGVWLSHGRDYSEQRFSPLKAIDTKNVGQVGLAWSTDLDVGRGMEATPIVVDGTMYVTSAWSIVYALDAKTGDRKWTYDPKVDKARGQKACCDVVNRGVAVWKGKVYVGTIDGRLVALNAKDGTVAWDKLTVDQSKPYTITGAPRVIKGKVMIGNGGAELGVRGYISAYDAETGEMAWRFFTTPNPAKQPDNAASDKIWADKGNATWDDKGEWVESGGGGTAWDAITYDPKLDMMYVGIGNGNPWNRRLRSPSGGDNWFLSSILALKPDTGEYVWHYQTTPGETWDYTATQPIILATLDIGGAKRDVLMQAPKNGFFYVIDRKTGELLAADKYAGDITWATGVDMKTGKPIEAANARYEGAPVLIIPGPLGSHNWHPMSFSPETGLVYIPVHTLPSTYADEADHNFRPGFWNTGTEFTDVAPIPTLDQRKAQRAALKGKLVAWDPVAKKARWEHDYPTPWNGGTLATAGGLVFQGSLDGKFRAFDAAKGDQLWETDGQYPVMSGPMSYAIDGEQYIAVTAGWGTALPVTGGGDVLPALGSPEKGRVLVYKIGGTKKLEPYEVFELDKVAPTEDFGNAQQLATGRVLYDRNCMVCHGPAVVSSGVIQDLRWGQAPATKETFADVVLNGKYASAGMASFSGTLSADDTESVRAYIVNRANEDAKAYAAQPPAPQ